ncbi:LysR family transcriptional regulator [Pseudooctadecabacter jejudonensis]|uniref:Hydrogen peroxide-inducible genes activator n=1 Tax=Pseudooctadecabacter jejudonensis TaxID=1391910 RepID=A0A1Y5RNP4_9RHOB|nr:LysR family transcriptional regulator [Pseudooctadecabacter jejudonensis]SLN21342.1 Hydrogen peroxide-inducible genes activator [Pseudooctadecabacter jejudonensis]
MSQSNGRITLWNIEVFVATTQETSISGAAKRLQTSAATVSQQLTSLEGALGTALLNRSARPVSLTPAGEIFLRRANAILNEAEMARSDLALTDMSRLTRLRLGMIEDFDANVTPRLLSEMGEALKSCQFLLETGASHQLHDLLETRSLDVIVTSEIGVAADWMEIHPLFEEPFVAAVPKGVLAQGDVARQLRRLPLIQYTTRHHMGRIIADHLARQNVRLAGRFELDSYHAIMAMVAAGTGWSILTPLGWLRAQRFRESVDLVPLPFEGVSRRISLTARRGALGDMPDQMALKLRRILTDCVVKPALEDAPWLDGKMRVL